MERNYQISVAIGLGIFSYIYFVKFDSFSETVLVQLTLLWYLPLIFGINGLVAEKLIPRIQNGEAVDFKHAIVRWMGYFFGVLGLIPLFPFLFLKSNNSLTVALWATAIWGIALGIFFMGIFPIL